MEICFLFVQLIIFSDSPSSQYRNRFTIFLLTKLCEKHSIINFEWLYSESGHGKGAPDGVGAALKRTADAHVSHGHSVLTATDMLHASAESKVLLKIVNFN